MPSRCAERVGERRRRDLVDQPVDARPAVLGRVREESGAAVAREIRVRARRAAAGSWPLRDHERERLAPDCGAGRVEAGGIDRVALQSLMAAL